MFTLKQLNFPQVHPCVVGWTQEEVLRKYNFPYQKQSLCLWVNLLLEYYHHRKHFLRCNRSLCILLSGYEKRNPVNSGIPFLCYREKLSAVFRRVRACAVTGVVVVVFTGVIAIVASCVGTTAIVVCIVAVVCVVCIIRFVFVVIIVVHNLNTILSQLGCAEQKNIYANFLNKKTGASYFGRYREWSVMNFYVIINKLRAIWQKGNAVM